MKLYVIRHAEAMPREGEWVVRDADRPLTDLGQRQCRQVARALQRQGASPGVVVYSPLLRARQTALALRDHWGGEPPALVESEALAPGGKKRRLVKDLHEALADEMAVVGHNPDLSELVGWLLGERRIGIDLEKAGVACLEFEDRPRKGAGALVWLVTPAWMAEE